VRGRVPQTARRQDSSKGPTRNESSRMSYAEGQHEARTGCKGTEMRRLLVSVFAIGLTLSGNAALAEVPLVASVVDCEIRVQGSNLPVNALVDLTVLGGGGQTAGPSLRFTDKIRTTATGTASATVALRQVFPGKDLNGDWGVSMDIGITRVSVSGCLNVLPGTSTGIPAPEQSSWWVVLLVLVGALGASLGPRMWSVSRRSRA
jgi:hypothetical protein